MPRAGRQTGRSYESRAPLSHPDARRRYRDRPTAEGSVTEPPQADDGIPTAFQAIRHTVVPLRGVEWVRRVDRVSNNAHNIRMFEGGYVDVASGAIDARPGSIFLISTGGRRRNPRNVEHIHVYIYLPDDLWFDTGAPPTIREQGWHRILRNFVASWTVLSRVQRIMRACIEGRVIMQEDMHRIEREAWPNPASPLELATAASAAIHFSEIANRITGDIEELTNDSIRRAFDVWVVGVCRSTGSDRNDVVEALSNALVEPEPQTGGDLAEQLQALGSWLPDRDMTTSLDGDELVLAQQVVDNVQVSLRDERHQREWQYTVMRRLGMSRRGARMVSLDRSLTEILVGNHYDTAVNYLDRFYNFRKTDADSVERVLAEVANEGATKELRELPPTENRLARNIKLRERT